MIKGIFTRLNQPFPSKKSLRRSILSLLYVSIFIAAFLFIFKPFGMAQANNPLVLSLGYGVVSLLFSISFELFFRFVVKIQTDIPSWTLWKWLVQSFLMVSWIAFGNYLLDSMLFWGDFGSIVLWLEVWLITLAIGCMPVFVSGLVVQMQAAKSNTYQANDIDLPSSSSVRGPVVEFSLNSNELLKIATVDLLFVEAMQNYVQIHAVDGDKVSRHMVRNTISSTLQSIEELGVAHIVRCHRSYLVNIDKIDVVEGNAQGLKLILTEPTEKIVPVSRGYISAFKRALELGSL